jgi:putative acetyltransferase
MIQTYRPQWKGDFERLNRAWIEKLFVMEPQDYQLFNDPENEVIQGDGMIFFILEEGSPVATAGVKPYGEHGFELVKMAVDEKARGKGYARQLCMHAIDFAKQKGKEFIVLYTHSSLTPAIALYKSLGFENVEVEKGKYARADVKMQLNIWKVTKNP